MGRRETLHSLLLTMGTSNVYFQPPENVKISYPAIIYQRNWQATEYANNNPYTHRKRYQVTVIDRNPDSTIPEKVADLPECKFATHFAKDGLNHDIYNLYF